VDAASRTVQGGYGVRMAQIVVWGHREPLRRRREALSDAIHSAVVEALEYPEEKRFHRFVGLDPEDFVHPASRSEEYIVIEISMFEGRSDSARRRLIEALFQRIEAATGPRRRISRSPSPRRRSRTGGSAVGTPRTSSSATASRFDLMG
jgi:hypothetical protein